MTKKVSLFREKEVRIISCSPFPIMTIMEIRGLAVFEELWQVHGLKIL